MVTAQHSGHFVVAVVEFFFFFFFFLIFQFFLLQVFVLFCFLFCFVMLHSSLSGNLGCLRPFAPRIRLTI